MDNLSKIRFVFFGSSSFSVRVLEAIAEAGLAPVLVVTAPDKPKGRGRKITPSPVKQWAEEHGVSSITPASFDETARLTLNAIHPDVFIVASYGKIFPRSVFEIPPHGTLNVHPSLLPRYRGPSPIPSVILANDKDSVGVSIIMIDEKVDHGPIIAEESVPIENWPVGALRLEQILGAAGGRLLAKILPDFLSGKIKPIPQDDAKAILTKKFTKEDGEINLADNPVKNFLKIRALEGWPGAFFSVNRREGKIRVLIKEASLKNGQLVIERVVPEGKPEMPYEDFLRGTK